MRSAPSEVVTSSPMPAALATTVSQEAVIVAIALGTMLAPLNSTMIAVALPKIIADFHVSITTAGWLVTSYLIAMASLQPVAGKLGDRLGRRRLIIGGVGAVGVAFPRAAPGGELGAPFLFPGFPRGGGGGGLADRGGAVA